MKMKEHQLRVYLREIDMSMRAFAEIMDISHNYLSSICTGRRVPSKRLARDIKRITDGAIVFKTKEDLEDDDKAA